MGTTELLILVVALILLFGGVGGYHWRLGRGRAVRRIDCKPRAIGRSDE
jgi:hypothetical protein